MAQSDFGPEECRRYMKLAFAKDDGEAYARLMVRLDGWGLLGEAEAGRLASEAFFGLRPSVLGRLAVLWPGSVSAERADGVDLCRGGLALAIAKGDRASALGLAKAMMGLSKGGARLLGALAEAVELVSGSIGASWSAPDREKEERLLGSARAIAAECERVYLDGGIRAGAKRAARSL